ncbi:MAG: hypothetical protein HYV17_00965 [Xanthomonadales bacterium]|nr:hypothetical protein [Xanthomonadales bacterium]
MRALSALLGLAAAFSCNAQGVIWPAASAPCNGTLQACIDAQPANFTVEIASNNPVNIGGNGGGGNLNLPRSISLLAASGYHPSFPNGVGIQSIMYDATTLVIRGIALHNGKLVLRSHGSDPVSADVRRVDIDDTTGNAGFDIEQLGVGHYTLHFEDNRYLRRGGTASPLDIIAGNGTLDADIRFNVLDVPDNSGSAYGLLGLVSGSAALNLDLTGNRVHGSFSYGALCAVVASGATAAASVKLRAFSNIVTSSADRVGTGICAFGGEAAMSAYLVNNTLIDLSVGAYLGVRPFSPPLTTQAISGYVFNNLIGYNQQAVYQQALASGVTNGYNLLHGNAGFGTGFSPAGASTITASPKLTSRERPYLASDSPARNAGDGLALLFAPGPALPLLDADGFRRVKESAVDVGAYEFGDAWFRASAPAIPSGLNWFGFSDPSVDGLASARLQATANHSVAGGSLLAPFGVYQYGGPTEWAVYAEDTLTPMPSNAGFNLFEPAAGGGRFLHTLSSSSTSSQLNDSSVNGLASAMVFVTHNWNPGGGGGVYNNHPTGVYTYADNNWYVQSGDGNSMPSGAAFNVYAQEQSPSVFRAYASGASILGGTSMFIDAAAINVACAIVLVTPWTASSDNRSYDLYQHPSGQWSVYSPAGIPDGTQFNVMYSPRQIFECSGPLFRNGFE